MAGNGYFDTFQGVYVPRGGDTWDDLDGSSAGTDWDSFDEWDRNPVTPLTFTTAVQDFGTSEWINYIVETTANKDVYTTVEYSDTVDSAGELVSPSTISVSPGDSLSAAKGRYWQFTVSVDYEDSAGDEELPFIASIETDLRTQKRTEFVTDVNTNTLAGTTGQRQLTVNTISKVTTLITQAHAPDEGTYVEDTYVATGYVETSTTTATPIVLIDKSTSPITLNIFDVDTFGKRKRIDCVLDAQILGLPALSADESGNILEAT